jgi:hypothetical protein
LEREWPPKPGKMEWKGGGQSGDEEGKMERGARGREDDGEGKDRAIGERGRRKGGGVSAGARAYALTQDPRPVHRRPIAQTRWRLPTWHVANVACTM